MNMKERLERLKADVQMRLEVGAPVTPVSTKLIAAILGMSPQEYRKHAVVLGEWCEDCNKDYKQAVIDNDEHADDPVGSCEECGMDIYAHDSDGLCDQCDWARFH